MLVPRAKAPAEDEEAAWARLLAEAKARLIENEERDWERRYQEVRRALAAAEDEEWSSLRLAASGKQGSAVKAAVPATPAPASAERLAEEQQWEQLRARALMAEEREWEAKMRQAKALTPPPLPSVLAKKRSTTPSRFVPWP